MNKHDDIASKIITARPDSAGSASFVAETMKRVREQSSRETFLRVLRRTNATKQERFFMKLRSLSTASLIALAIFGLVAVSGTAYAAYSLFNAIVTVKDYTSNNDDNKRQYTLDVKNCGISVGGTPIGNGTQAFEVARSSALSTEDVKKVISSTCEYQSIMDFANKQWPNDTQKPDYKKGDIVKQYGYVPEGAQTIGSVTAISDTSITLRTTVYEMAPPTQESYPSGTIPSVKYYPTGTPVITTLPLTAQTTFFHNRELVAKSTLKVGDTVYIQTVNEQVAPEDSQPPSSASWKYLDPRDGTTSVIGVMKVDFDPSFVQTFGIGNPKLVAPIVKLVGCQTHKNKGQMCVTTNSEYLRFTPVYAVEQLNELGPQGIDFQSGKEYFRTDIPNSKMGDTGEEVEGRIAFMQGKKIVIRSRSKGIVNSFNVTLPYDVVGAYNAKSKTHLQVGDYVELYYNQLPDEKNLEVRSGDIVRLSYLNYLQSDGSMVKY